ncbi:MAG: alpha/beta hydrolase [Bacteroidia bacterium]
MKNLTHPHVNHISKCLASRYLKREVSLELFVPIHFQYGDPLFLVLDGQDWKGLGLNELPEKLKKTGVERMPLVVAVHAEKRLQEYGVVGEVDFKGRGSLAHQHARFVMEELLPWLEHAARCPSHPERRFVVGCSLGGLTAFDLAWKYPDFFAGSASLSGSFWWRSRDLHQGYTDQDRIAHRMIRMGERRNGLKFFFQAGTRDETNDRNHNGIIDSIDDTLDLITELIKKGYKQGIDVSYQQVEGGRHDLPTWKNVLPSAVLWLMPSADFVETPMKKTHFIKA